MLMVSTVLSLFGPVLIKRAIDVDIGARAKTLAFPDADRDAFTSIIYLVIQLLVFGIGYFKLTGGLPLAVVGVLPSESPGRVGESRGGPEGETLSAYHPPAGELL